jgi:hypothetical protein
MRELLELWKSWVWSWRQGRRGRGGKRRASSSRRSTTVDDDGKRERDVTAMVEQMLINDLDDDRLIPKADRKLIHEYLFREGVLVAKKDFNLPKHQEIDTKNLYVRYSPTMRFTRFTRF